MRSFFMHSVNNALLQCYFHFFIEESGPFFVSDVIIEVGF